jgi:hypothetical protein
VWLAFRLAVHLAWAAPILGPFRARGYEMAFWPRRTEVSLPQNAIDDITTLLDVVDKLPVIVESARKQSHESKAVSVIRKVARDVGIDLPRLDKIFNALENLKTLAGEQGGGGDRPLDQIKSGLDPKLAERVEANKGVLSEAINAYSEDNPVSIAYKAQRITFLRDKLFHDAELITDIRPVFDSPGKNILEMIVTHTFVITYYTRRGWETVHIALDAADVISLRKACDRAIIKAKTLKVALDTKWKTEIIRDDTDA